MFSFFSILYSHKSHLSGSVLLSFSTGLTFYFLQFTNVGVKSWYNFWFHSLHILSVFCLAKVSCSCVFESLSWRSCTLSNFLFNYLMFFSISLDWIQAAFIDFSNLALSFLFFNFSQLDSFLSCVTFACRFAFLSSRLKNWVSFLMKKFVSLFLSSY